MDEQKRGEFLRALVEIDASPSRYVGAICQLAFRFTLDAVSLIETGEQASIKRRAVEDSYLQLIAVAGSATVAAQSAAYQRPARVNVVIPLISALGVLRDNASGPLSPTT